MALVTLSIGSNIERTRNIKACLDGLLDTFGELSVSRVFESEPVGLASHQASANFYNLAVALQCDWPVAQLRAYCKALEARQGRRQEAPNKQAPLSITESALEPTLEIQQPLDVDILSVGQLTGTHDGIELPRRDLLRHAFVLKPLAELLPDQHHPLNQRRYDELWKEFEADEAESQPLWPVELDWRFALPCRLKI